MSSSKRPADDADNEGASSLKSAKLTPPDLKRATKTQVLSSRAYIKRIRMHNFLPYEECVVYPGPRLNLVVGPNGSGKSTIVSAICLCLAGAMKVMERGKSVGDYVRNGQEVGELEVDLNDPKSGKITFKRRMTKSTGKSEFWINGKLVKEKEVNEKVRSLDVQLDNLCHFLPQEKVEAFGLLAGKPTEMLLKVEEAVGSVGMRGMHEALIGMQSKVSSVAKELENKLEARENAKSKIADLEKEMERHEQLEELTKKAHLMTRIIPYRKSKEAKEILDEQQLVVDPLEKDVVDAKKEYEELQSKENISKGLLADSSKNKAKSETELNRWKGRLDECKENIGNKEGDFDDLRRKIRENDKKITDRENRQTKIEAELRDFKEKKAKQGKEPPDLGNRINQANAKTLDLSKKVSQKHQEVDGKKKELRSIENEKMQKQKQVRDFRSMADAKAEALMRSDRKVWEAWNWLKENADRFEKPVLGPICLELSVNDKESANMVDKALSKQDKFSFIVQTDKDYSKINEIAHASGDGHPIKQATFLRHTSSNIPAEDLQGISAAKKAEYGIEGALINRVQASDPVKSWLCIEKFWHRRATGTKKTGETMDAMINDQTLIVTQGNGKKMHKLSSVITPEFDIRIQFSFYGNKQKSVTKDLMKPAQLILHGDDSRLDAMRQELRVVEGTEDGVKRTLEVVEREDQELRTQHTQAQQDSNDLRQEKALYDTKQTDALISRKEKEIVDLAKNIDQLKKGLPELKRQYGQQHKVRVEDARKLKSFTDKAAEYSLALLIADLEIEPLRSAHKKCQERARAAHNEFEDKKDNLSREEKSLKVLTVEWQRRVDERKLPGNKLSAEEKQMFAPGPNMMRVTDRPYRTPPEKDDHRTDDEKNVDEVHNWETAREWQAALDDVQDEMSKIGVVHNAREQLDEQREELADLDRDIPELLKATKNHGAMVADKKKEWLDGDGDRPGLRSLIKVIDKYFSETFEKLGNVGQVKLDEATDGNGEDDFKNYGVDIMVKFREEQALQLLKATVQSGGEKSLSTMLFLLSMQQITKCPFRVVDEINQGMDAHYERAVFERIVEWSSKDDTSQCFLITPKIQGGMLDNVGKNICVLNIFKGRDMCSSAAGPRGHF